MSQMTIMPFRRVFRLGARLFLLTLMLVWLAWVVSGWYWFSANQGRVSVLLGGGRVLIGTEAYAAPYGPFPADMFAAGKRSGYCPTWAYWEYFRFTDPSKLGSYSSASLLPLGMGLPFLTVGLWYLARWRRKWACGKCGYDLRGLPPGAPCPECGTAPSPPRGGAK